MVKREVSIDERWKLNGLETLILENDLIRAVVIPEMGGNIYQMWDKASDRNLLFNHPRVEPRRPSHGEAPENRWCGGIDEVLPTFWESSHRGEPLSPMGEVFPLSWQYDVLDRGPNLVTAYMFVDTFISTFRVERWLHLRPHSRVLQMQHRITNLSDGPFEYLWGLHVSFAIPTHYRIDVPENECFEERCEPEPSIRSVHRCHWPEIEWEGQSVDMRFPPPKGWRKKQLHWLTLDDGWFAFTDLDADLGLGYQFPHGVFPYGRLRILWDWRGIRCVILASASGYPSRLHEAAEEGEVPCLSGGESLTCESSLVLYKGLEAVRGIGLNGQVEGT